MGESSDKAPLSESEDPTSALGFTDDLDAYIAAVGSPVGTAVRRRLREKREGDLAFLARADGIDAMAARMRRRDTVLRQGEIPASFLAVMQVSSLIGQRLRRRVTQGDGR